MDPEHSGKAAASAPSLMPPYVVFHDFLDAAAVAGLLDHAASRQADFTPTLLGSKTVDPAIRISVGLRDLGSFRQLLKDKIFGLVPELITQLKVTSFESSRLELELVAHGDGAFYKRHIDTQTARYDDVDEIRVLSGVYYFNAAPKAFSGGALRLHAIGGKPDQTFVDIEPAHNSLLVFPSWAPHEVMPVRCPSGRFRDSRFAVNCWLHRKKPGAISSARDLSAEARSA
jgi:SM-20-related protein